MSESDDLRGRARKMHDKAKELENAAEQATDAGERQRLQEKARRLESQSEQISDMASGDIYPIE
ncbi:DUF6381 family protein [Streptomyces sp. NBC_01341]|uniref:DUF6381 family protein n=1 Tax=Streptomyces sp. NBC_01341 TaxID=2903831 RepID=UPI002E13FA2B|nr:DUF6381 family protein [Streptomyces sp. NBC_01341]